MEMAYYGYEPIKTIKEIVDYDYMGYKGQLFTTHFEDVIQKITSYKHRHRNNHVLFHRQVFSPLYFEEMMRQHPKYDEVLSHKNLLDINEVPYTQDMFFLYSIVEGKPKHLMTANLRSVGEELGIEGTISLGKKSQASRVIIASHFEDLHTLLDTHNSQIMRSNPETNIDLTNSRGFTILRTFLPKALEEF